MLISDYANLPENKSGFWIQKQYNKSNQCSYLVFYQGYTCFGDSISKCKKDLEEHYQSIKTNQNYKVGDHIYDANNELIGFVLTGFVYPAPIIH